MPVMLNYGLTDIAMNNNKIKVDTDFSKVSGKFDVSAKVTTDIYARLNDQAVRQWIAENVDELDPMIEEAKKDREQKLLRAKVAKNKYYRSLVKHVNWSGNACIVYWSDGSYTKSHWNPNEEFDAEKAILVCMARKLYGNTNIYNEVLNTYAPLGEKYISSLDE